MAGLYLKRPYTAFAYAWASFCVLTLLVLTISYLIILLRGCLTKIHPLKFPEKIILPETLATERLY